jgi:hypothetical protein
MIHEREPGKRNNKKATQDRKAQAGKYAVLLNWLQRFSRQKHGRLKQHMIDLVRSRIDTRSPPDRRLHLCWPSKIVGLSPAVLM